MRVLSVMVMAAALVAMGCSPSGGGKSNSGSGTDDTGATTGDTTDTGDDTTDTGGDTTDTGDDTTDTGVDTTDPTDTTGDDTGGGGDGACQNEADQAIISEVDVTAEASSCGLGCLGQGPECGANCVVEKTGLTADCAGCYGESINCAIENCVAACAADPAAEACVECREENGCTPGFYECSGEKPSE